MYKLFYKPDDAFAADFIPFWKDGKFRLFYLKDWRNSEKFGEGVPWYQITTSDFCSFDELGEMIPRGRKNEQDYWIFTGSIIEREGQYHIFYTGHNSYFISEGKPQEGIMHAVSDNLKDWVKRPEDTFFADFTKYEMHDFRDPFVYFDEETNRYHMLLVSRLKDSGYTSGFTAVYSSDNLKTWRDDGPFWSPGLYHTHECPDFFRIGDWWYLIYSEYSDRNVTRYVMTKTPGKDWIIPPDDTFDGRAYYAAKSYSDGEKRYLFGWVATKQNSNDDLGWQWGGNLEVHEIFQRTDGSLGCRMPDSINQAWQIVGKADSVSLSNHGGKCENLAFTVSEKTYRIDATFSFTEGTRQFGIQFAQDFTSRSGYKYEFFPFERSVRFNSITSSIQSKDVCRTIELDSRKPVDISLVVDGDICVLYINNDIALTSRIYNIRGNDISFFTTGGSIQVRNIMLSTLPSISDRMISETRNCTTIS